MNHIITTVLLGLFLVAVFVMAFRPNNTVHLTERTAHLEQVDADVQHLLSDGQARSAEQLAETTGHDQRDVALTLQRHVQGGQVHREERPGELPALYRDTRTA